MDKLKKETRSGSQKDLSGKNLKGLSLANDPIQEEDEHQSSSSHSLEDKGQESGKNIFNLKADRIIDK